MHYNLVILVSPTFRWLHGFDDSICSGIVNKFFEARFFVKDCQNQNFFYLARLSKLLSNWWHHDTWPNDTDITAHSLTIKADWIQYSKSCAVLLIIVMLSINMLSAIMLKSSCSERLGANWRGKEPETVFTKLHFLLNLRIDPIS